MVISLLFEKQMHSKGQNLRESDNQNHFQSQTNKEKNKTKPPNPQNQMLSTVEHLPTVTMKNMICSSIVGEPINSLLP